ncbi:RDD family protein [Chelatococcus reniformis]|uniref:RDD domain-containing protein n=1 Tax=Chelatococcus reniformis TaxID=1494448 RepID=A0A916UIX7_9HYPH|nr:RDD family protein [Chelatococcus reniformis]GGC74097.1 hypothetical protein GCM10010994_35580 [Chelatococcus reniformis]
MSNTMPQTLPERPYRTDGVLVSRFFAYLIDLILIGVWCLFLGFIILVLGVVTFGLGWALYTILIPGAGILYSMITVGGSKQATIGMRMLGLRVIRRDGALVDPVTAGAHALFFYVAGITGLLLLIDIVVGLVDSDRRMLHDQLAGVTVVRSA